MSQILAYGNNILGCGNITQNGIAYQRPLFTGQVISYIDGDDGFHFSAGTYNYTPPENPIYLQQLDTEFGDTYFTLKHRNAFGTKERFTNTSGGTVWDGSDGSEINYVIDHLTGLAWSRVLYKVSDWETTVSGATTLTINGFSDWRANNMNEMNGVRKQAGQTYAWFVITRTNSIYSFWSSTTTASNTLQAYYTNIYGTTQLLANKTSNFNTGLCRNHYN